jgi:AraC-like DNA-binding protein
MAFSAFSSLRIADGQVSPLRCRHLPELADNDDLIFTLLRGGKATWNQGDREANVSAGEALLTESGEAGSCVCHTSARLLNFRFNRRKIAARIAHADTALLRPVPKNNRALQLLTNYASVLDGGELQAAPALREAIDDHMHDLVALVLGATRDATEIANKSGVRAARLHALKEDIASNLTRRDLSLDLLAGRHGISPRYIRSLFESEGTMFTDFVLNQRLSRVHRCLVDLRYLGRAISTIAYDTGFGDLSYFNHAFRRRYSATPSDIRASAGHENDG